MVILSRAVEEIVTITFFYFLEEIDKEEEGIFASVEFVNSPDLLESSLDDVYELFEVEIYEEIKLIKNTM